jgi:uncharacterized protein (TIGR02246 family)
VLEGWNRGSGEAFAAPFAEDADFIAFDGSRSRGRRQIAASHQDLFDRWLKGTRLVGSVEVRFLTPDVALVIGRGGTIMRGKSQPAPERDSIQTLVAVRQGGQWRFAAFQNTRVRPISGAVGALIWVGTDLPWKLVASRSRRRREVQVEARSRATTDRVYALLVDGSSWTRWSPIEEVGHERDGDPPPEGVGAIRRYRRGRTVGRDETVELRPGRRFAYRSLSGLPVRDYRGAIDLEHDGEGGTRIVWSASFEPKLPGTGPVLERGIDRFLRGCAQGLADYAGAAEPPSSAARSASPTRST